MQELNKRYPEAIVTTDVGQHQMWASQYIEVTEKKLFITSGGLGTMGFGLPSAIGAQIGCPEKRVISISGDGGFQMNLQELQTIIHHHMGIKIFLINNGGYHSIRQTQKTHFHEPLIGIGVDSHDLSFPSMEKLAWAYGYPYVAAHHNSELGAAVEKTLATEGPVICEIFVDMKQGFEPKASAKMLPDGTMVSVPLEDLAPFLPEEELKENMYIPLVENK